MKENNNNNTDHSITAERKASTICPWCKSRNAIIKNGIFYCSRCSYEQDISTPPEIKVIGWTSYDDRDYPELDCNNPKIYSALVKEIRERGYSFSGYEHMSNDLPCTPVINNGCKICCGPRAWGSIMAEAHGVDNTDGNAYIHYYLSIDAADSVYPRKGVDHQSIIPFETDID